VSGIRTITNDRGGRVTALHARTVQGRGATRFGLSKVFSAASEPAVKISPFHCRERGSPRSCTVRSRSAPFTSFSTSSRRAVSTPADDARLGVASSRSTSTTGTWKGPFGYAGGFGYQEDSSGLKLLGHRYYDPTTGRFLSRDPAKDGRNWYGYCANEPMSRVDPTGLWRRTAGAILGGIAGFILTGGNPVGAAVGAAIGGALGSAADQAEQKGEIDWGQAATDGAVDGATSLIGGAILGKLIKLAMPMQLADDGTVLFLHHTSRKAAEAIAKEGVIRPGGPGLGNLGGNVNGLPRPMLGYARLMGVPAEDTIEVWVPRGNVTQNGLGHLLHKGPIEF